MNTRTWYVESCKYSDFKTNGEQTGKFWMNNKLLLGRENTQLNL